MDEIKQISHHASFPSLSFTGDFIFHLNVLYSSTSFSNLGVLRPS